MLEVLLFFLGVTVLVVGDVLPVGRQVVKVSFCGGCSGFLGHARAEELCCVTCHNLYFYEVSVILSVGRQEI